MMMERNNGIRIGSLPGGERRGTSRADAGRDSMRTVSGSLLNRRARAGDPEETTAELIRSVDDALQSGETSPTSSAGTSTETTTRSILNDDARRKWSQEELEELMFCYFKAKAQGSGYIKRFHKLFTDRNPHNPKITKFTGNTLSNQARSIITRKMLSTEILNEIKSRAEQSGTTASNTTTTQTLIETPVTYIDTVQRHQIIDQDTTIPNNNIIPINNIQATHTEINTQSENILQTSTTADSEIASQYEHMSWVTLDQIIESSDTTFQDSTDRQDPNEIILDFLQTLSETKETLITDRKHLPKPKFNKQFIHNLNQINEYIPNILNSQSNLREINDVIYATAKTLIIKNGQVPFTPSKTIKPKTDPPWKRRITEKIGNIRKEIGQLVEIRKGTNSKHMQKIKYKLYDKYNIFTQQDLDYNIEILEQKLKALAGRIKRYDEMNKRKEQNRMFHQNQHTFFRTLNREQQAPRNIPSKNTIQDFWTTLLSQPITYNKNAPWIVDLETDTTGFSQHNFNTIDKNKLVTALKKLQNWKTPGIDKVQNYYIKYLTNTHEHIVRIYNRILNRTEPLEEWFTTGQVILIPKNENTHEPQNWRPIACLPTLYKILTSIISNELYIHCENNEILQPEQRGCRRHVRGCKDHLMVNKAILEDAHKCQKNLSMGWVDYRKAFDSMSHEWLLKILSIYKSPQIVIDFLQLVMPS